MQEKEPMGHQYSLHRITGSGMKINQTMLFFTTMMVTISEPIFKASFDTQAHVVGHEFSFRTTKYHAVVHLRAEWLLK